MNDAPAPITLYSSWRGLLLTLISPAILIALPVFGMIFTGRFSFIAVGVLVLGLVLAGVSLFDLPRRCVFDQAGVHRRCALRRHTIEWHDITAIGRAPGPLFTGPSHEEAGRLKRRPGGLTALVSGRKYLLVDVVEGATEYEELRAGVKEWNSAVAIRAQPPPRDATPTWTYHERRTG